MGYRDTSENSEINSTETNDLPEEIGGNESDVLPEEVGGNESESLPEEVDNNIGALDNTKDVQEEAQVVKNKRDGCERENKVEEELRNKYPESEGYQIVKEAYLRDENGNYVIDPETGKRRRIDFVVVKDGKVVESIEVTSMTAPKEEQMAKEKRIREQGGNYIYDNDDNLVEFPPEVETHIERRE